MPSATRCRSLRRQSEEARRHHHGQRAHPARHHRFLRLPDQGARRQSRRAAAAAAGLRHGELPQADRPVRHQQADPRRRHAAGAGIARRRCRPRRASASGCSSGIGSSRACRTSTEFVADIRKRNNGKVPTARHWFGYTSVHTFALVANQEKTPRRREARPGARRFRAAAGSQAAAQQGLLPQGRSSADDVGLRRRGRSPRARTIRRICSRVDEVVPGDKTAPPVADTGCTLQWPA